MTASEITFSNFNKFLQLSAEERVRLFKKTLIEAPDPLHIWIFGFGSLMWKPGFLPIESHAALLEGFERKFNIWSTNGRGSEKKPGLGLCLEPATNGRCMGIAYKISPKTRDRDLKYLWDREMTSGVYLPKWVSVELDDGSELKTLTYISEMLSEILFSS